MPRVNREGNDKFEGGRTKGPGIISLQRVNYRRAKWRVGWYRGAGFRVVYASLAALVTSLRP